VIIERDAPRAIGRLFYDSALAIATPKRANRHSVPSPAQKTEAKHTGRDASELHANLIAKAQS
jgi:hypothetical protein